MKKINRINPDTIKPGDLMAIVHYVKVKDTNLPSFEINCEDIDLDGHFMKIQGKQILENAFSADQYVEEIKVSKTQAADFLVHSINRPFTVNFTKSDGTDRTLRDRKSVV